jgi:hypothetical protein
MGNHECNGDTDSNMTDISTGECNGAVSNNYLNWFSTFVQPLGKTLPYWTIPINATDGSWTSKFIFLACNAWDSTQNSWLVSQLAVPTTFTFVVRHEGTNDVADNPPCVQDVDTDLLSAKYDQLIVGHSHEFSRFSAQQVVIGNGGAPLDDGDYGFTTFQQQANGTFKVINYDYSTVSPVDTFYAQ